MQEQFYISVNTLQSWESDKNSLTTNGANKLQMAFARAGLVCSEEWLLTGKGQPPMLLHDDIQPSSEITEDLCILRELEVFKAINPDAIAILITDNGMEPLYEIGDYVGGNKKKKDQILAIIGQNCIVETIHGETLVRKVLRGSTEQLYTLVCINAYTDQEPILPDMKLNFAANIVWHRKKEKLNE